MGGSAIQGERWSEAGRTIICGWESADRWLGRCWLELGGLSGWLGEQEVLLLKVLLRIHQEKVVFHAFSSMQNNFVDVKMCLTTAATAMSHF